ncbi:THUMP domain-containing class I SAM-dependent RNA methyltransferase [Paenibacillus turpanensis]|uniref:THUMP domain-containing class I SAM-dependent RNA methyltransferase n=1 Tax=Paenibacillus turpanensis TaxID=2689078 RepID=UPI00140B6B22|nr:class I SAM-dependent RNA methyltransferase [Paenibacillus turpanensis]
MERLELVATCPMGLEAIVARELMDLGYTEQQTDNGSVTFYGTVRDIARTNLWLRTADRILIRMGRFPASTFDELFEGTKALPWEQWIGGDAEFPVQGKSHKSQLTSVPACQGIVKKAIVEKLKQSYHTEWFEETGPRYVIEVALLKDIATLTIDTTGPSLHKRGYRKLVTEAPLKETLAAAMVILSRWGPHRPLYDPFCGSGTIPIEAALIAWNVAPGLRRTFPSDQWPQIGEDIWDDVRDEAYDSVKDDIPLEIAGSDIDPSAIEVAEAAVKAAGLHREIRLSIGPAAKIRPTGDYGCFITNPPYGERLGTEKEADAALKQFGSSFIHYPSWSLFALSPNKEFEQYIGRKAEKKRKLYNGRIECQLYQYLGPLPPRS